MALAIDCNVWPSLSLIVAIPLGLKSATFIGVGVEYCVDIITDAVLFFSKSSKLLPITETTNIKSMIMILNAKMIRFALHFSAEILFFISSHLSEDFSII